MPTAKKATKRTTATASGTTAEAEEIIPAKIKRDFDFETPEILPIEKVVDDAETLVEGAEDSTDELGEDAGLDEEELDPFKDKWEE